MEEVEEVEEDEEEEEEEEEEVYQHTSWRRSSQISDIVVDTCIRHVVVHVDVVVLRLASVGVPS